MQEVTRPAYVPHERRVFASGIFRLVSAVTVLLMLVVTLTAAPSLSAEPADGKGLYVKYCAGCHGSIDKSDVRGATQKEIKYAMTDRMCGESGGNKLTDAQLETIARALSGKAR